MAHIANDFSEEDYWLHELYMLPEGVENADCDDTQAKISTTNVRSIRIERDSASLVKGANKADVLSDKELRRLGY